MAKPDYTSVPDDVRKKIEDMMRDKLVEWYDAQNKPKMRSRWHKRAQATTAAPGICKDIVELLIDEAEKGKTKAEPSPAKPSPAKPAKPSGKPEKSGIEELLEEIKGPEPEDLGVPLEMEGEISDELKELVGSTKELGAGQVDETSLSKMSTTANRICACPRCVKIAKRER